MKHDSYEYWNTICNYEFWYWSGSSTLVGIIGSQGFLFSEGSNGTYQNSHDTLTSTFCYVPPPLHASLPREHKSPFSHFTDARYYSRIKIDFRNAQKAVNPFATPGVPKINRWKETWSRDFRHLSKLAYRGFDPTLLYYIVMQKNQNLHSLAMFAVVKCNVVVIFAHCLTSWQYDVAAARANVRNVLGRSRSDLESRTRRPPPIHQQFLSP